MVLEDHTRKKRRLIPPMRAALGDKFSPFSWAREIVPELIWITLLVNGLGPARGIEVARLIGRAAAEASKKDPKPLFAGVTSFSELSADEKQEVLTAIDQHSLLELQSALKPLAVVWPNNPLSFLQAAPEEDIQFSLLYLSPVLEEMFDRTSRAATIAISSAVYLGFDQNKIFVAKEIFEKNATAFIDVEDYPETDASRKAGSFFRTMAPIIFLRDNSEERMSGWSNDFWGRLSSIGGCLGEFQGVPQLPDITEGIDEFVIAFTHFVHTDFRARESAWPIDLGNPQERQVILALLARQATVALELVSNPGTWNPNSAPIMLRAMADAHITLVWLMQNPRERVKLYVDDGLGSIKLEIAHRKAELKKKGTSDPELEQLVEHLENWLASQQADYFTEVNLGNWSGKTTRVMAQEAGCIDFYNYVFQPFSAAVHSYWSHVGRINVEFCQNPTHNFHFLPIIPSFAPDTHWCLMAAKYLSKTFRSFDEFIGRPDLPLRSYNSLLDALTDSGTTKHDADL